MDNQQDAAEHFVPLVSYLASVIAGADSSPEVEIDFDGQEYEYKIHVEKDGLGALIGKKGRTVKSIRSLVAALSSTYGLPIHLDIYEKPTEPSDGDKSDGFDDDEQPVTEPDGPVVTELSANTTATSD